MAKAKESESFWHKVWVKLIAGVLLALVLDVVCSSSLRILIHSLLHCLYSVGVAFFTVKAVLPFYLVALLCVGTCVAIGYFWKQAYEKSENYKTSFLHYRTDEIAGAVWTWSYLRGRIISLMPHCPNDSTPMANLITHDHNGNEHNSFLCQQCSHTSTTIGGNIVFYYETIARLIEGKINRKEYLTLIETKKPS